MRNVFVTLLVICVSSVMAQEMEWFGELDSITISPTSFFIVGPVTIDTSTGEITIEEGVNMSDASRKFWRTLEQAYPYLFDSESLELEGRDE